MCELFALSSYFFSTLVHPFCGKEKHSKRKIMEDILGRDNWSELYLQKKIKRLRDNSGTVSLKLTCNGHRIIGDNVFLSFQLDIDLKVGK